MIRLPYASRRAHVDRVLEDRARLGVLSQPLGPLLLTSDSALRAAHPHPPHGGGVQLQRGRWSISSLQRCGSFVGEKSWSVPRRSVPATDQAAGRYSAAGGCSMQTSSLGHSEDHLECATDPSLGPHCLPGQAAGADDGSSSKRWTGIVSPPSPQRPTLSTRLGS